MVSNRSLLSRRRFLACGAAFAAAPVAGPALRLATSSAWAAKPASPALTRTTFAPLVNPAFSMTGPTGGGSVVLAAVRDIGATANGAKAAATQFSLLFQAPPSFRPAQGVFVFGNPALGGPATLLAVPVGAPEEGTYEVIVNNP